MPPAEQLYTENLELKGKVAVLEAFRANCQADLIVHNLQVPPVLSRGLLDSQALEGQQDAIIDINHSSPTFRSRASIIPKLI